MDHRYFARYVPETGDYLIFDKGMAVPFGRLANCEIAHIFCCEGPYPDEALAEAINAEAEGDFSLREWLAVIRKWCDLRTREQQEIMAAERWAEQGWLRAAEAGNMESWEQEDRDREIEARYGRRD